MDQQQRQRTPSHGSWDIPRSMDLVSLRDYLQLQIDLMEQRCVMRYNEQHENLVARIQSQQAAIDKAESALNTRLEAMNEIRSQLATQRADFVTADRLDSQLTLYTADRKALSDKVDALAQTTANERTLAREQFQKDMDVQRDRNAADIRQVTADIRTLRESRSQSAGSAVTAREFMSYGLAVLAIIAAVLSRFI